MQPIHPTTPTGLHHLTAIAGNPQTNVDFYTGVLGLRLIKKTVNFDDPSAYHLYYGDETGSPGSIITFFYWPGHDARGRTGPGQTTAIVLSAPAASLDYWQQRLASLSIAATRRNRFGEEVLAFADPDGIPVEIVAVTGDPRTGWQHHAAIPAAHALRGLHTAELTVRSATRTEQLLTTVMGCRLVRREGTRARFTSAHSETSGSYIDIIADASAAPGAGGSGTIHHIAFSVPDDDTQLLLQKALHVAGYSVSEVRDRNYFHSIYYREPGGILFEIATATPGFAIDESPATLGTALKLPTQFERARSQIERLLPPLHPSTQE